VLSSGLSKPPGDAALIREYVVEQKND